MHSRSETVIGHAIGSDSNVTSESFESREPAAPESVVGTFAVGGTDEIGAAVAAAGDGLAEWSDTSILARAEIVSKAGIMLRERLSALERLIAREVGKPIREAHAELERAALTCDYVAGQARLAQGEIFASDGPGSTAMTWRRPVGIVGVITPWNFPVGLPLWKLAPALLYGNAVVWKPAELSSACAHALFEVFRDAGVPAGALNVVFGEAEAGAALTAHPDVGAVTFTGSSAVGHKIGAIVGGRGARLQLELGGKNAVVVLDDADLEQATALIVQGAVSYAGQKCSATSRVVAAETVADELLDRLKTAFGDLRIGDPLDQATEVGPLITEAALERTQAYLAGAVERGGELICGGRALAHSGHFIEPALVARVGADDALAREEVFGPLLAVLPVGGVDDAVETVNATEYGFFTTICSSRPETVLELAPRIESGIVKLNTVTTAADPHMPFGGWKASGNAVPEQGLAARDFFTRTQALYLAN